MIMMNQNSSKSKFWSVKDTVKNIKSYSHKAWMKNKAQLYKTENYIQYLMIGHMGKNIKN